jgi:hypothetical protein
VLFEATRQMPSYANSIAACRVTGVEKAHRLTAEFRKAHPSASANVACAWQRGIPTDPA